MRAIQLVTFLFCYNCNLKLTQDFHVTVAQLKVGDTIVTFTELLSKSYITFQHILDIGHFSDESNKASKGLGYVQIHAINVNHTFRTRILGKAVPWCTQYTINDAEHGVFYFFLASGVLNLYKDQVMSPCHWQNYECYNFSPSRI